MLNKPQKRQFSKMFFLISMERETFEAPNLEDFLKPSSPPRPRLPPYPLSGCLDFWERVMTSARTSREFRVTGCPVLERTRRQACIIKKFLLQKCSSMLRIRIRDPVPFDPLIRYPRWV
jgi:hypothetical protein